MAEFDPVEWWNENARRFDHRIEKCGDNSNASDALRALAAEARRRAMEEAERDAKYYRYLCDHWDDFTGYASKKPKEWLDKTIADAIERAKGQG